MSTIVFAAEPFDPKDPEEVLVLGFEFAPLTDAPLAPAVTCERVDGAADPDPSAMLSGAPQVVGSRVLQRVIGGVHGCDYLVRCRIDTADGGRFVLPGMLYVRRGGA